MASRVGNLNIDLTLASAAFEKGMAKAGDALKKFGNLAAKEMPKVTALGEKMQSVGKTMMKRFTAPVLAAGATVAGSIKHTADYSDQIDKMAERTGLTRTRLQELRYTASQLGADFNKVEYAAGNLTRKILEIDKGTGPAADAMRSLGINVRDTEGNLKSMDDLLPQVITHLQSVENETERNAKAVKLLGRGSLELAPLLNAGAGELERLSNIAHETGQVMDDETIKAFVAFKDELSQTQGAIGGIVREVAAEFLPVFRAVNRLISEQLIPRLRQGVQWFRNLDGSVKLVVGTLALLLAGAGPTIWGLGTMLILLPKLIVMFKTYAAKIKSVIAAKAALFFKITALIALVATLAYSVRIVMKSWEQLDAFFTRLFVGITKDFTDFLRDMVDAVDSLGLLVPHGVRQNLKAIKKDLDLVSKAADGVLATTPIVNWGDVWSGIKKTVRNDIDDLKGAFDDLFTFDVPDIDINTNVDTSGLKDLQTETDRSISKMEQLARRIASIQKMSLFGHAKEGPQLTSEGLDTGTPRLDIPTHVQRVFGTKKDPVLELVGPDVEQLSSTLTEIQSKLPPIGEIWTEGTRQARVFGDYLNDRISSIVGNLVGDLIDGFVRFEDVVNSVGKAFKSLAADIAAAAAKALVFKTIGSMFGIATGGFGSLVMGAMGIPGLASGGIVTKPTLALIGEGSEHEAVLPLSKLASLLAVPQPGVMNISAPTMPVIHASAPVTPSMPRFEHGTQEIHITGETRIAGDDLILIHKRATDRRSRVR